MANFPPRQDGCPIPLPVGSVDGTAQGNILRPIRFPGDLRLDELTGNDFLDGQIIIQLSGTMCLNGLSVDVLLSRLQAADPDTGWTMELLASRLRVGAREGRFCQNVNRTWVLNDNMVKLNVYNRKFQGLTTAITPYRIFQTTVSGVATGAYIGDECGPFFQ
jgi:hypothetical protein